MTDHQLFRDGTKPDSTYARVTVTLEMVVPSSWSSGTTLDQVYHQAADDAIGAIERALPKAKIIGRLQVDSVTQTLRGSR